jgi:2-polyprenyl-6-methoxyphenol hydroxylase-like FAD-dependent oxidoreductase
MRIVIIGAGVAGCVMARQLSQSASVEVICLERVSRDDHSEAGTGLNVGPSAVKAVKAIDPELADRITEASYLWRNWRSALAIVPMCRASRRPASTGANSSYPARHCGSCSSMTRAGFSSN